MTQSTSRVAGSKPVVSAQQGMTQNRAEWFQYALGSGVYGWWEDVWRLAQHSGSMEGNEKSFQLEAWLEGYVKNNFSCTEKRVVDLVAAGVWMRGLIFMRVYYLICIRYEGAMLREPTGSLF